MNLWPVKLLPCYLIDLLPQPLLLHLLHQLRVLQLQKLLLPILKASVVFHQFKSDFAERRPEGVTVLIFNLFGFEVDSC